MYGCENWTIKKAECQRIDAFELWHWSRFLRVPQTARRSILNIHWKDWCWSSNTLDTWCEVLTHGKDPDAGQDWRQEKGMTEDEMVGWHHQSCGHEFEQALGIGDGQGSLACCSPRGRKELDTTERLNWPEPFVHCSIHITYTHNLTKMGSYLHTAFIVAKFNSTKSIFRYLI